MFLCQNVYVICIYIYIRIYCMRYLCYIEIQILNYYDQIVCVIIPN